MEAKLASLYPEITLFITTCAVMVLGLSPQAALRRLCPGLAIMGLVFAGVLALTTTPGAETPLPMLPMYAKTLVAGVGVLLALLLAGSADRVYEAMIDRGAKFDALRSNTGEFWSFFLFSMTGLMLCAGADDLIWLFLALELVSLPTYVMVAVSTGRNRSKEAAVKYFFLGALGAAVFLYGFVLIYGAAGSTDLATIATVFAQQQAEGGLGPIAIGGIMLSLLGLCFKIAAVPMHFYTPDVYQGASAPVAAMLAFVPKTAGFIAILLILACVRWPDGALPEPIHALVWVLAVLTMTVGNVLALLQRSAKRLLAYSSIAHSGYMLVGVLAGPGLAQAAGADASIATSGFAAVLFYLFVYGISTVGAFAVLACLERTSPDGEPEEADDLDDLRGLWKTHPSMAAVMALSAFGLLGLPPLLGFVGKLPLFTSAISAEEIPLVIILGLNSAIAAFYYLRLVALTLLENPEKLPTRPELKMAPMSGRRTAALLSATGVIVFAFIGGPQIAGFAERGATYIPKRVHTGEAAAPVDTPADAEPVAVRDE